MISSFLFQIYSYCVGHPNKNAFRIGSVCLIPLNSQYYSFYICTNFEDTLKGILVFLLSFYEVPFRYLNVLHTSCAGFSRDSISLIYKRQLITKSRKCFHQMLCIYTYNGQPRSKSKAQRDFLISSNLQLFSSGKELSAGAI